jgi:hypothetical protein
MAMTMNTSSSEKAGDAELAAGQELAEGAGEPERDDTAQVTSGRVTPNQLIFGGHGRPPAGPRRRSG